MYFVRYNSGTPQNTMIWLS